MRKRIIFEEIVAKQQSKLPRIIVLTGARQTGKTTIVKQIFTDYTYLAVDDVVKSRNLINLTVEQWKKLYPKAVLDEIQCEPKLFHSIKSTFDQFPETRYVLLGSSQFLLLEKIRESLAGRCIIFEIYPLILPELLSKRIDESIKRSSFFVDFMLKKQSITDVLPSFVLDENYAEKKSSYDYYLKFGAYPALTNEDLTDNDREEWLTMYVKTFLERDIRDLVTFRDLEPFVKLQRYLANTTGNLVNFSSIAKEAGVSVPTVQRYVRYMEMSYQSVTLPAWASNSLKKLVKSSKIHFLDGGILRSVLQKKGAITGGEFESAIVAEIYKQVKTYRLPIMCYHLRTQDGREIDVLLESEEGFIAIEIKSTENVSRNDAKHLFDLQEILNKPLIHSFVLSNDVRRQQFGKNITAMHVAAFLT
ncbi:MAG: ATP-binding protein [Bacteroidales bacterium]|jgi:predicted AAA+ superfamily ATPase|nr:ATP-binding protein [Bacteroidales bacterium]